MATPGNIPTHINANLCKALIAGLVVGALAVASPRFLPSSWQLAVPSPLAPCKLEHLSGLLPHQSVAWRAAAQPPALFPQLALRQCSLRRITHREALDCLAGRPLVLIGDSVMRYQYLSLAHFLDHGDWPTLAHFPSIGEAATCSGC